MEREAKCSQRLVNIAGVILPAKQANAEVSQGDRAHALRDQGRSADPYLDTWIKHEFLARNTVLTQATLVVERLNPPSLRSVGESWSG
jgi:hypothetical protein